MCPFLRQWDWNVVKTTLVSSQVHDQILRGRTLLAHWAVGGVIKTQSSVSEGRVGQNTMKSRKHLGVKLQLWQILSFQYPLPS